MSEGLELHPVQHEMLRIERGFEKQKAAPPPLVDECIRQMTGFQGEMGELDRILAMEVNRCFRLLQGHYSEWLPMTARNLAAVAFLQGVTFATAVQNVITGQPHD